MTYEYDLFLSFKNSTEQGLTEDRKVAERLYNELEQEDLGCFFSNRTLKETGTANYMLEIQSALEHSRSILVLFSRPEYISTGWVAQEWMSFLNMALVDPLRDVFTFSISKGPITLPPFLRPYECFVDTDAAIEHILNSKRHKEGKGESGPTRNRFLSGYWGLFENSVDTEHIEQLASDQDFSNFEVYKAREQLKKRKPQPMAVETLHKKISEGNTLASYVLSMYYRQCATLDLKRSRQLIGQAYQTFVSANGIVLQSEKNEVAILIWHDREEYSGAFYMAEAISDVLEAYGVKHKLIPCKNGTSPDYQSSDYRKTVAIFDSERVEDDKEFLKILLSIKKQDLLIGLNAFTVGALPYDLRSHFVFDSYDSGIANACKTLLSQ